jgi:hypothetical protein
MNDGPVRRFRCRPEWQRACVMKRHGPIRRQRPPRLTMPAIVNNMTPINAVHGDLPTMPYRRCSRKLNGDLLLLHPFWFGSAFRNFLFSSGTVLTKLHSGILAHACTTSPPFFRRRKRVFFLHIVRFVNAATINDILQKRIVHL